MKNLGKVRSIGAFCDQCHFRQFKRAVALSVLTICGIIGSAQADNLHDAMALAYENNPTLNAARAGLRATDEALPQAKGALRPLISGNADVGVQTTTVDPRGVSHTNSNTLPAGFGISVTQNIFRGFRTRNSIRRAISEINAGRSGLLNEEQNTLLDAVEAYMNVVRDSAIVGFNVRNVEVLREQLRSTNDRFEVGEVTRTDVAQAQARVQEAISILLQAESNLRTAQAVYQQIVGRKPQRVSFPRRLNLPIPKTQRAALVDALKNHPAIKSAQFNTEAAEYNVKEITGELLPTFRLEADASSRFNSSSSIRRTDSASLVGRLTIPIYQQGTVSSRVRQAKQTRSQRRLETDSTRDQVRAAVLSAWAGLAAARGQITSDEAQIAAAQLALDGVIEEERVGQRTTLDVLDAQTELLSAQVSLSTSRRDSVVASYSLIAAIGRLSARNLGLSVREYNPRINTKAVQDRWFGLRTSDGN